MRPLLLLPLLAGCAHQTLEVGWAPAELLKYDASKYPDDPAVGLFAEDGVYIASKRAEDDYTQVLRHRAYAIQNEKAFDLAEVRIALYGKNKLAALKARQLRPDGTVREVLPSEVIADESDSKDGKSTAARVFRFPNVEVGSILEWVYVIEEPFLDVDEEGEGLGEYPMRHYEAWIEANKQIILEARFYNQPAQAQSGPGHTSDFLRIGATVRDIPARPKHEDFAANWTYSQPRWAYRMLRWNYGGHRYPVLETWNDMISRWARRAWAVDKDALLNGFAERVDVNGCGDARCRVERGLSWVREHTEYSGLGSFGRIRKATEIVSSREATSFERGFLLRRLLEDAGVKASLAVYTARHSGQVDKSFPTLERFNRLLVFVPAQDAFKEPVWLDPACEQCAVGQVSDEAREVTALVFRARILPVGEPVVESEDRVVSAQVVPDPARVVSYETTIWPSGDASIDVSEERSGRWALSRCADLRSSSAQSRWDEVSRELAEIAPAGKLKTVLPPACTPREAKCVERHTVALPAHAVFEQDRLLVPMTLIEPFWSKTFFEDQRLQPIAMEGGDRKTELKVLLKTPPGWKLSSPARSESASAPGITATFETKPSAEGAEVKLTVAIQSGYHEASDYAAYRKVGEFVRNARTRVIELTKK